MNSVLKGYKLIFFYLSIFLMMIGGIILTPLIVLPFYPEEANYAYCFLIPGIIIIFIGYLGRYFLKSDKTENLQRHQDSLLVTLVWIFSILSSSFPWLLTGEYNFTEAVFECTSGYTTTGLSIVDPDTCPKIFLMYRSIMLFVGGIGLVLVLTCAISDRYGLRLFNAEGHTDKLLPNLKKSARVIFAIYSGYILIGTIAYVIAGMSFFDAINHSIAALSTGGFSTRTENILYYHSVAIDLISDVLMLLGGTNFLIHLYLFRGQFKKIWKHCETRFIIFFTLTTVPLMTLMLYFNDYADFGNSLNIALFQYISALTTTGFANIPDMNLLPSSFVMMMIILMIIGAGAGSTGGGIKQYRFCVTIKGMWYNIKSKMFPNKTISSNYIARAGQIEELTTDEVHSSYNYVMIYLTIFLLGSLIFTCFGNDVQSSMFEFASALGTVGVSNGITFRGAHPVIHWTATIGMFLGRLEILVVFYSLARVRRDMMRKR